VANPGLLIKASAPAQPGYRSVLEGVPGQRKLTDQYYVSISLIFLTITGRRGVRKADPATQMPGCRVNAFQFY